MLISGILYIGSSPIFENDHYRYIWEGKVLASGENPYVLAPNSKQLDKIKYSQRDKVGYPSLSSIYPPLAQVLFLLVSPFKHTYAMLILQILFLLILIWIIPFWFKESSKYFLLILPFLLKEFVQSVHLDLVAVTLFTLGISANKFVKRHFFLILSFLSKILSILVIPYLFLKNKSLKRVPVFLIIPLLLVLFLYFNHSNSSGSSEFVKRWHWNSFLMDLFLYLKVSFKASRLALLGGFVIVYPYLLYRALKNEDLLITIFAFFLLCSPVLHPWYFLWLVPLVKKNKSYYYAIASSVFAYMPYGLTSLVEIGSFITFALLVFAIFKDLRRVT